jgi:hypothetical protein
MNVELEYKIDRSALAGDTKVVLQQLQLGERVESPGAMRLPLDLAIAIYLAGPSHPPRRWTPRARNLRRARVSPE